jgi:hypothetical protein
MSTKKTTYQNTILDVGERISVLFTGFLKSYLAMGIY